MEAGRQTPEPAAGWSTAMLAEHNSAGRMRHGNRGRDALHEKRHTEADHHEQTPPMP